jgi:NAD(P)H-hydrate epimerase
MIASALHETTFVVLPDADGALVPDSARALIDHLLGYDALLIGCGFGRKPETVAFVQTLLEQSSNLQSLISNLVFDADALFALAQSGEWWTRLAPQRAILTPHPGEMAMLTGLSREQIQADRVNAAKKFAARWQQIVVLKGAHTVVAAPDGRATLLPFATPALATAGTGDVLAGTIVAMLAQGLSLYDATIVGAYIHGLGGEIAAREIGDAGVVAGDLLKRLPVAMRQVKRDA